MDSKVQMPLVHKSIFIGVWAGRSEIIAQGISRVLISSGFRKSQFKIAIGA